MIEAGLFDFMGVVGSVRMAFESDPGTEAVVTVLDEEVVDCLERLREAEVRLAMVSNNDRAAFAASAPDVMRRLEELFDVIVFSSDVGVDKPHPRIYRHALERFRIEPMNAWYFDDLSRNVDAALALGMTATVVTSSADVTNAVETLLDGR